MKIVVHFDAKIAQNNQKHYFLCIFFMKVAVISILFHTFALAFKKQGWLPEWPNGADCKSAGDAFGGSNPSPPTTNIKVCHLHGAPFFV